MNSKRLFQQFSFLLVTAGVLMTMTGRVIGNPDFSLIFNIAYILQYFTVLTNILLAVYFFAVGFIPESKTGRWFRRDGTKTGILLYIWIVGLVYHFMLASVWSPQGFSFWGSNFNHYLAPLLILVEYVLNRPQKKIGIRTVLFWLIYPLSYSIISMIRGALTGWYPYPFLDAGELGTFPVVVNITGLCTGFFTGGLVLSLIHNLRGKRVSD